MLATATGSRAPRLPVPHPRGGQRSRRWPFLSAPGFLISKETFFPEVSLTVQARIANGNTMKLDLKKLVVITTDLIIYIPKNLGRKEERNQGRSLNKKPRRQRGGKSKAGNSSKNLLCNEPLARHFYRIPGVIFFISVLILRRRGLWINYPRILYVVRGRLTVGIC